MNTKLLSNNFYLEFSGNQNDWCSIFLGYNNNIKLLGADTLAIVVIKILSILDINSFPEPNYTLDSKLYYLFIALFEKHTVGYARVIPLGIEIHFRDVLNQPIVTVFLSHQERRIWKNKTNSHCDFTKKNCSNQGSALVFCYQVEPGNEVSGFTSHL